MGGVTRLKHHLAGPKKCPLVPSEVKKKCAEALKGMEIEKEKKKALAREIGRMEDPQAEISRDSQSSHASNTKSRSFGPLDQFDNAEARQIIIENRYKKEERVGGKKVWRCLFACGLLFYTLTSPY